jgi:hypothetical protein
VRNERGEAHSTRGRERPPFEDPERLLSVARISLCAFAYAVHAFAVL